MKRQLFLLNLVLLVLAGCAGLQKKPAERPFWNKCTEVKVDVKTGDKTFICTTVQGERYSVTVHKESQ